MDVSLSAFSNFALQLWRLPLNISYHKRVLFGHPRGFQNLFPRGFLVHFLLSHWCFRDSRDFMPGLAPLRVLLPVAAAARPCDGGAARAGAGGEGDTTRGWNLLEPVASKTCPAHRRGRCGWCRWCRGSRIEEACLLKKRVCGEMREPLWDPHKSSLFTVLNILKKRFRTNTVSLNSAQLRRGKRPWRLHCSLANLEPERSMKILQEHQRKRLSSLKEGLDLKARQRRWSGVFLWLWKGFLTGFYL